MDLSILAKDAVCHVCSKEGHFAKDCWNQTNKGSGKGKKGKQSKKSQGKGTKPKDGDSSCWWILELHAMRGHAR